MFEQMVQLVFEKEDSVGRNTFYKVEKQRLILISLVSGQLY